MKIVSLDIWDRDVIFFTWDYKKVIKFAKEEEFFDDELFDINPELSRGRTILTERWVVICWIKDKNDYWHVAHEIFHCVEFILDQVWIPCTRNSDEVYAYTIQYLTNCFYWKNKK